MKMVKIQMGAMMESNSETTRTTLTTNRRSKKIRIRALPSLKIRKEKGQNKAIPPRRMPALKQLNSTRYWKRMKMKIRSLIREMTRRLSD
jgi:hypothetical protein